ncbi:S-layer homology domain-containing protein [Niameybacter massiliensis]|uniref:S-layer homology domain-containing protein n=1 Tax=Niameybacter massiliensis TaxID=1658108 RepID=UPI0006B41CD4|nr:S-layer homology domain-containing protein [Niameybacter massiliensis]
MKKIIFLMSLSLSMPTFALSPFGVEFKVNEKASKLQIELTNVPSGTKSFQLAYNLENVQGYTKALWASFLESGHTYIQLTPSTDSASVTLYAIAEQALPSDFTLIELDLDTDSNWAVQKNVSIKYLNEFLEETTLPTFDAKLTQVEDNNSGNDGSGNGGSGNGGSGNDGSGNSGSGNSGSSNSNSTNSKPTKPSTPDVEIQPETPLIETIHFNDVDEHWASDSIKRMAQKGLITGYIDGSFKPNGTTTRSEFATLIAKAFELKATTPTHPFQDVKSNVWYTDGILALYERGIITGLTQDTFGGDTSITNEQMATILYRTLESLDIELPFVRSYIPFKDSEIISPYALDAVKVMYESGLVNGLSDHSFAPKTLATRAQVATILDRILLLINN